MFDDNKGIISQLKDRQCNGKIQKRTDIYIYTIQFFAVMTMYRLEQTMQFNNLKGKSSNAFT